MSASVYIKVREQVEQHLNKSPRLAILHGLLFTAFSVPVGLWSILTHPTIDGVVYWTIFLWSIVLSGHMIIAYLGSGAWGWKREHSVQKEVVAAGSQIDLTDDEMIDLHLRLTSEVQLRSQKFNGVFLNGLGNFILWPGVLLLMLLVQRLNILQTTDLVVTIKSAFTGALIGTLLIAFLLPIHELRQQHKHKLDALRAVYGKRKRDSTIIDAVLSDGELSDDEKLLRSDEEQPQKQKR